MERKDLKPLIDEMKQFAKDFHANQKAWLERAESYGLTATVIFDRDDKTSLILAVI